MTITDPKIEQFATQFDAAHLELATLAAFPIGVTVDMLYQLWYNFKDSIVGLPMIAVSNVLLSPLFRPMGNGIFEMEKETRAQFLEKIRSDTEGGTKLYVLANFTKAYTQNRLMGERYTSFRETLLMNAEVTLDPVKTLQTVIQRLQTSQKENNRSEVMRLRDLIELFAVQEKGLDDVHNSTFYPILQYSIALKGAYMNAPTTQIEQKIDGIKGATINLLKEKTPNAQMLQLPASLVGKGILQKLDGQKEDKKETQQQILALITGVNDYKNPIPKLQGALNDGEKIDNWLNHNFGTPDAETVLKTSKLFNKQATRDAILKDFQHQAAQAKENDFVFFSFSGYGVEFDEIQPQEAQHIVQAANISQQTTSSYSYGQESHAELKNRIRELISKAQLEEAIEDFIKWASANDKDLNNQLIIFKGQLSDLKRQENLGLMNFSDASRDRARISNSILSLLDNISGLQNPTILQKKIKRSMLLPFDATSKEGTTKNGIWGRDLLETVKQYPQVNFVFFLDGCYCYCLFPEITDNMVALINYTEGETGMEMPFEGVHNGVFTYYAFKTLTLNPTISYAKLIETVNAEVLSNSSMKPQTAIVQCSGQNYDKILLKDKLSLTSRWHRRIYDSQNTDKKKVKLMRSEGDAPVADEAVNKSYDNVGLVLDYFYEQFGWNSLDNKGMEVDVNVHYLEKYSNGFWDRESVVLGDGDGINFKSFAFSLVVLANELTKGIIQYIVDFVYRNQSGAIYEHFSTVFASAIVQYYKKQTAHNADWLLGEDILIGSNKGKGICSLKAPADKTRTMAVQPDHFAKLYKGETDNGGVHLNSGIPNHAFYLVSMEIGTQQAALLWFEALKTMKSNVKFINLYKALNDIAPKLMELDKIPKNTQEVLLNAFTAVGIVGSETVKKEKKEKVTTDKWNVHEQIKTKIKTIVNIFETGSPNCEYDNITIYNDGKFDSKGAHTRQITYGSSQTTEQGNLRDLIKAYINNDGMFSKDFEPFMPLIGKQPLADNKDFIELLKRAANDDIIMRDTQDAFFDKRYYEPSLMFFNDNGFTLPLSLLVIFDSYMQSGGVLAFLRKRFEELPPKEGGDEKAWVKAYLRVRKEWLLNKSEILAKTTDRVDTLIQEIEKDNWLLEQPINAISGASAS